jgi:Tol biopolymer transport system component
MMKQNFVRLSGIGLAILSLCSVVAAQSSPKTANSEAVKALFGVHEFVQVEISPDGKRVAWVESLTGPNGEPSTNSAIYVAEVSAPESAKRITAGGGKSAHEEHDVAWSPDSQRLAFLSDAASTGQLQLFVADATSGAAKKLTSLKGFLATPGWSPDGKTIALLFTENATRAAGPLVAETPDEGVVSEDFLEQRLTLVDPVTSQVRQISPADLYVYEFDWSPDSRQLAITAAQGNGDDNWYIAGLSTIEAASGEMHAVVPKPGMQIAVPRWSPTAAALRSSED